MSQYAGIALAERSFPLSPAHYQRRAGDPTTSGASSPMPVAPSQGLAYQSQAIWPGYYAERTPIQPQAQSSFNSYIVPAGPSSSSSLSYSSSWQNVTSPSALTSVGPAALIPGFDQAISSKSTTTGYQTSDDALPVPDYPTCSQRASIPHAAPSSEPSSYFASYSFKSDRHRSPSSHASAPEHTGWDSPKSSVEELEYPQTSLPFDDRDGNKGQSQQAGSRHPSLPAPAKASSLTAVKVEPEDSDGRFIMELSGSPSKFGGGMGLSTPAALHAYSSSLLSQSLAPPTEVPLRATQATKKMRAMMGVFRLNPFSMHSLSVNAEDSIGLKDDVDWEDSPPPWSGGEAHALEEEPVMFEFQLNINSDEDQSEESGPKKKHPEVSGMMPEGRASLETLSSRPYAHPAAPSQVLPENDEPQLRSFSPSFELHPEDYDNERRPSSDDTQHALQRQDDQDDDQDEEDQDGDQDQQSEPWGDVDYATYSEVDSSSTTTRSVHTPFSDSPQSLPMHVHTVYEHHQMHSPPFQSSAWDAVNEQYQSSEDHRFMNQSSLVVPFKSAMVFTASGIRAPRLHTTTSHPYLRKNLQNQPSHPAPHALSHLHGTSQVQPQGFSLLIQPTHHSHHPAPSAQQPPHTPPPNQQSEHTFSTVQQHYQESHLPVDPNSSLISNHLMSDLPEGQGPPPPSYMRVIRGARNPSLEYERMGAYSHKGTNRISNDGGNHPPPGPSETYNAPQPSNSMVVHYMQPAGNAPLAGNRRWSLPETVGIHSHGGQYYAAANRDRQRQAHPT